MIKERKALSMGEAKGILGDLEETEKIKATLTLIKKFSKLDAKKAKALREELEGLDLLKMKQADIVKIIDLLPENASELNKIFTEVTLDGDETNKILEAIKKHK